MLTWKGKAALAVLGLVVLLVLALFWANGRADRLATKLEGSRDAGASSALTLEGERATNAAEAKARADLRAQQEATDELDAQARRDPEAATPLPAGARERIRAGDDRLCGTGPCR